MQVDKLRHRKLTTKPLYIKKITYVGIRKLIPRDNPYQVSTMETYHPFREHRPPTLSLRDCTRRQRRRRKIITVDTRITHEVHLTRDTVTDSITTINDPNVQVAAVFNIFGSARTLLNDRRSGTTVYMIDGADTAYFMLTWNDVLYNPMREKKYTGAEQTKRKLERMRYPTQNFNRIDRGVKVYYLQEASPEEYKALQQALTSVKNPNEMHNL